MSSELSAQLERLGNLLRRGAESEVDDTKMRLESAAQLYKDFISSLIVTKFDIEGAARTAEELFGSSRVKFAAIDGSEDQRLIAGLAVFWGGSYASTGAMELDGSKPKITYDAGFVRRGRSVSSCVPIYVDRVGEVDRTIYELTNTGETTLTTSLTEQAVVDNSRIAGWIMVFSELYLAYRMVVDEGVKVLLMDRSLSNTQTSLIYDTSSRSRWESEGAIHGLEIDSMPIDKNEMGYGRYHYLNHDLGVPPLRGDAIRYALIYFMQERKESMDLEGICNSLGVVASDRRERIRKYLVKAVAEGYLLLEDHKYSANPRYTGTWERLRKLVEMMGHQLFEGKEENPMRVRKGGALQWITTQDMSFLSLYCLYMLVEECWRRHVLLIGVTKDTTARDFKTHLVPVCGNEGVWKVDEKKLREIPSTDRMFLQAISLNNYEEILVPWSLVEYDTAFQTIVPDFDKRKGFVSGARRNRISAERLFAKTYIQLDQSRRDPQFRSNVLFIDRLVQPQFDRSTLCLNHDYGGAIEPMDVIFYGDRESPNPIQNLVMIILKAMGAGSIPEVFGHNRPLFIADKIAKIQRSRVGGMLDATGHWLMNSSRLRRFCFYMNTFRERRAEVEYTRGR